MSVLYTVYKRTATGAIQQWCQELEGNQYRTISGQIDGKQVISEWTVCEGKNIGRSNETTPAEQAQSEVESNYTKKLAQGGYHERIEDVDKPKFFAPMLAQKYEDRISTEDDFSNGLVYSQPKLDGIRCIITADGMWSRKGKPILSAPHIMEQLAPLFEEDDTIVLDGELYAHKLHNDFNQIVSLAKKQKPTSDDLERSAELIQYWVYDLPSASGPFGQRFSELEEIYWALSDACPSLVLVTTGQVIDASDLDGLFQEYISQGMEGQMLRIDRGEYEQKRSKYLLKRKEFQDDEFRILRIEEGIGNRSGMAGRVVCQLPDGREFGSSIKGTHEYCKELLREADRYVGGQATVKFFEYTPDGVPRFPVSVALFEGERDL